MTEIPVLHLGSLGLEGVRDVVSSSGWGTDLKPKSRDRRLLGASPSPSPSDIERGWGTEKFLPTVTTRIPQPIGWGGEGPRGILSGDLESRGSVPVVGGTRGGFRDGWSGGLGGL